LADGNSENWIERTRLWMEESGTSQGSLARALECTRGAVGHYLAGRRQPTLTQMERIAGVMGVHPAWLLYGVGRGAGGEKSPAYPAEPPPTSTLRVLERRSLHRSGGPAERLDLRALSERCYGYRVEAGRGSDRAGPGDILVLDPQSAPQPGDDVLVGIADSGAILHKLIWIRGERLSLATLTEPRRQREYRPRELSFMHRVIAVVRRNGLPMLGQDQE